MDNTNDKPYEVKTDDLDIPEYLGDGYYEYTFAKAPNIYWRIAKINARHESMRATFVYSMLPDAPPSTGTHPPTAVEVRTREIAILFAGTNITRKDGSPAAPESDDILVVEKFVGTLPAEMVNEIWIYMGEIYPSWGPSAPTDWRAPEDDLPINDMPVPFGRDDE